jgi:hypothetical protein
VKKVKKQDIQHRGCIADSQKKRACHWDYSGAVPICERHMAELDEKYACEKPIPFRDNMIERGEEMFILNARSGDIYSLSSTAALVMKGLLQGRTFCSILEDMDAVFEIDSWEQALHDCEAFFKTLFSMEFIAARKPDAIP